MNDTERLRLAEEALRLVLLFHSSGWGPEKENAWQNIVGSGHDATTKVMCDHIRVTLERIKEPK